MKNLFYIIAFFGIYYSNSVEAQYLIVKKKTAKIRNVAGINGSLLEEVKKGTILIILQEANASNNNYYKVKCQKSDCEGWIVRTSVKRIKEDIPDVVFDDYRYATDIFGIGQIPRDYYNSALEMKGDSLKLRLHQLIRNHKAFVYDDISKILVKTDQDPYDTVNVILLYTGRSVNKNYKDRGGRYKYKMNGYTYKDAWTIEHLWPATFEFSEKSDTAYSDLHNIRPADRTIKTDRSNRSYDYGNLPYSDNDGKVLTECFTSMDWIWEPPDFIKGDIARMIFYMSVRYMGYEIDGKIKTGFR